jgi:hypothetical protein
MGHVFLAVNNTPTSVTGLNHAALKMAEYSHFVVIKFTTKQSETMVLLFLSFGVVWGI